jgi:hypothetical protein
VAAVKKILESQYGKTNNNAINGEIAVLAQKGLIISTTGNRGASGSYLINPDFENFDSRC